MPHRRVPLLIVDDHALFRAGLRKLLADRPAVDIVGEAGSAEQAFELLHTLRPRVVLMDVGLPGMNGLAACTRLRASHPQLKVVCLSMHKDEEYVAGALKAGAYGYILKESATVEELELAVASADRGQVFISPALAAAVAAPFVARSAPGELLTSRQKQVLRLLASGMTAKQVAAELDLSIKTVESHRALIMERLEVRSLASLVMYAVREGLISVEMTAGAAKRNNPAHGPTDGPGEASDKQA